MYAQVNIALWVLKSLNDEQTAIRASVSSGLLKPFRLKGDYFLMLLLMLYVRPRPQEYQPENNAQSRQWVGTSSTRPKKFKTRSLAGMVVTIIVLDAKFAFYQNWVQQLARFMQTTVKNGKLIKWVLL